MQRAGIFGPSLSGKTTLAKALSREYLTKYRIKSIVLDPNLEVWGSQAELVTNKDELFWITVWASRNCLVIVEESSDTIARNPDLIPVFTRLRHLNHKLIVVGHSGASLLPVMREQIDTLFLFRQSRKSAQNWVEAAAEENLIQSTSLMQFEFLHYERFKPVRKVILKL